MQTSKLVKNLLSYLSLLVMVAAIGIGMFIAKDLYQPLVVSDTRTTAQSPTGQNFVPLLIPWDEAEPCALSSIYTSLPPKCKTLDGEFIPLPGTSSNGFVLPKGK